MRLLGRHSLFGIIGFDSPNERTAVGTSGDNRRAAIGVFGVGKLRTIQAQRSLAGPRIGTVTGITVFRKNGLDGLVERKLGGISLVAMLQSQVDNQYDSGYSQNNNSDAKRSF